MNVPVAVLDCEARVASGSVRCGEARTSESDDSKGPRRRDAVLVGGQHQFVEVTSSNVNYNSGTSAFTFDVTVQNLIPQPMGTSNGTGADSAGVKIFFHSGPTATAGSGSISVSGDGIGTFTGAGQPFYKYSGAQLGADGILSQNETSSAKQWTLSIDPGVSTFVFQLYVWAEVPFPDGYIDVTPAKDTLSTGSSQLLAATIRNYVGLPLSGTVTWGTSDGTVASVDGSGNVLAVGAGAANITATSGLRSGSARINVCPALAVGGTYVASMPGASDLCFAGGAGSDAEYTYMPVNLSTSSALSLSVTATGIQAVTGPPSPNLIPSNSMLTTSGVGTLGFGAITGSDVQYLGHDQPEIKALMRDRSSRIKRPFAGEAVAPRLALAASAMSVGDSIDLNTTTSCGGTASVRTGVVRSVGQHVIIVADTANPAGGFTTAQYDSIAMEFDSIAYPVDSANFGAPTDLDGNGRVIAFYTRAVNELSPPASSVVTLGFFSSKDLFSSLSCPNSNEGEMFYMLTPDPTGAVNSNVRTVSFVRGATVGTMGHEFQHLINAWRRGYVTETANFEEGWLNEGLSHIAEELMFYRTSVGLTPRSNIIVTQLTTGPNASRRVAAFNTYANPNFGRLRGWLQRPDTAGAFKSDANSLAVRGAIWAFLRYATDRKNIGDESFFFGLVNNGLEGKANLQNSIGSDPDLWLRDFTAAMYDDDAVSGIAPEYQQPSWSFRSLFIALNGTYQLAPRPLTNGVGLTLSYARGGGTAYTRFGVPADSYAGVTALSGGVAPASPYALIVTRTK
jgi:hypothetical protein